MQEATYIADAKEKLRQLILNNGLKWGEGLLKNGNVPKWIFDLREVILTPEGSRLASHLLYEKINKSGNQYALAYIYIGETIFPHAFFEKKIIESFNRLIGHVEQTNE